MRKQIVLTSAIACNSYCVATEYNLALGSRRAEAVREFLSGFGISASVFTTTSFGEERPAVNRSDEAAWAQNRRVEFVITGGQIVTSEDN